MECEIFMRFPFMSAHSYPFIIYLAIKGFCSAIQLIVSTSICYSATGFLGFRGSESPYAFLTTLTFKNLKILINNILIYFNVCSRTCVYYISDFKIERWKLHIIDHHYAKNNIKILNSTSLSLNIQ